MKKLLAIAGAAFILAAACTTSEESTWQQYTEWRDANNAWLTQLQNKKDADGNPYYRTIIPAWNPGSFVLIHYFNDRAETAGNLSPLYTSTVDTRYEVHLYDGTGVDSSTLQTAYGPGIYRAQLNRLVPGWGVALSEMHCGDTAEVIVPYALAYGNNSMGSVKPYSNLRFNIRLVDIYRYETSPY